MLCRGMKLVDTNGEIFESFMFGDDTTLVTASEKKLC